MKMWTEIAIRNLDANGTYMNLLPDENRKLEFISHRVITLYTHLVAFNSFMHRDQHRSTEDITHNLSQVFQSFLRALFDFDFTNFLALECNAEGFDIVGKRDPESDIEKVVMSFVKLMLLSAKDFVDQMEANRTDSKSTASLH